MQEENFESFTLETSFRQLEDHGEHGLYQLMCNIHLVHRRLLTTNRGYAEVTTSPLSNVTTSEIARLKHSFVDVKSADRHRRNYILLVDFEIVLDKLLVKFIGLQRKSSASN